MTTSIARALVGAVIALAFAGTMLTTPVNAAAEPSPVHQAGPGYHQPTQGSCHAMSMRQSLRYFAPRASVDCDERHTSKTLVSKRLRGKVDWSGPTWTHVYQPCANQMHRALGGERVRALSAYELTFFIPTKQERARGAKWKRCDVVLVGGRSLQPLPDKLRLTTPLPDKYARCLSTGRLRLTVCSKPHVYRATGAFQAAGKKYPGEKRLTQMAANRCPRLVSSRTWRYSIPYHADLWRVGFRSIVCYSKTRS
jgi:hypothetical protein